MTDTNAVAADTEEQGSAVTSCTLYDRSSAAAGPKAKYAFLNLRSVEETSNFVAFDGVYLKAHALKVIFKPPFRRHPPSTSVGLHHETLSSTRCLQQ